MPFDPEQRVSAPRQLNTKRYILDGSEIFQHILTGVERYFSELTRNSQWANQWRDNFRIYDLVREIVEHLFDEKFDKVNSDLLSRTMPYFNQIHVPAKISQEIIFDCLDIVLAQVSGNFPEMSFGDAKRIHVEVLEGGRIYLSISDVLA